MRGSTLYTSLSLLELCAIGLMTLKGSGSWRGSTPYPSGGGWWGFTLYPSELCQRGQLHIHLNDAIGSLALQGLRSQRSWKVNWWTKFVATLGNTKEMFLGWFVIVSDHALKTSRTPGVSLCWHCSIMFFIHDVAYDQLGEVGWILLIAHVTLTRNCWWLAGG